MKHVIAGFLDVKHHITARIFVMVFGLVYAMLLVFLVTGYRTNRNNVIISANQAADAMLQMAQAQFSQSRQEVAELSSFLLSDQDVTRFLTSPAVRAPNQAWFTSYHATLKLMRNYITGRSLTIVGMSLVKSDGQTCSTGILYCAIPPEAVERGGDHFVLSPEYPYTTRTMRFGDGTHAVLIVQLAKDYWAQIYGQHMTPGYALCLYDADGGLLYANDASVSLPQALQEEMRQRTLPQNQASTTAALPPSGGLLFDQHDATSGITAVLWAPTTRMQDALLTLNQQLFGSLLALFISTVALSRLLALSITRHVKTLRKNAELIGQGRYGDILPVRSADEIGVLAQDMQRMAGEIQTLIADMGRHEESKREMELQILRAQVSPHFLYNALNTISYLSMLQGSENIHQYTTALIQLLQAALQTSDVLIPLEQELDYVHSYHRIMRYRSLYEVSLEIQVEPSAQDASVMRMLLQPIVENAMIHGLHPQQQGGAIRIHVDRHGEALRLRVTDNGSGMTPQQIENALAETQNRNPGRFSGIGIRNVQDRIRLQFGEAYGLSIASEPGCYTTVTIHHPYIQGGQV